MNCKKKGVLMLVGVEGGTQDEEEEDGGREAG